jgi:uncharacterized protein YndB with AHSA1/START domain
MKTEIITDKEKAEFQAKREFNACVSLVWRVFTESELLDQWWAPKPWKCETKKMDFKPKGKWEYDMVGPNGERHGAVQIFEEIVFEKFFSGIDAFTDEQGQINESMPVAKWKNTFTPTKNGTLVITEAKYPNAKSLETVLKMGMAEGLSMAHANLDEVLNSLSLQKLKNNGQQL